MFAGYGIFFDFSGFLLWVLIYSLGNDYKIEVIKGEKFC